MKIIILLGTLLTTYGICYTLGCTNRTAKTLNLNSDILACDTVTKDNFLKISQDFKAQMDKHDTFTIAQCIVLVKIYNTMHQSDLANDKLKESFISDFKNVFSKGYLSFINKRLDCTYGKGMTIYSKKYDLYVGIGSVYRCQDRYTILN